MTQKALEVIGIEDIQKLLGEIAPNKANNLINATVRGVATEINKQIKKNAPKDTGNLKKSFKVKKRRSPKFKPVFDVIADSGSSAKHSGFYWRFVEYGTGGKSPSPEQPFVRPAKDLIFSKLDQILSEQFTKKLVSAINREKKKAVK